MQKVLVFSLQINTIPLFWCLVTLGHNWSFFCLKVVLRGKPQAFKHSLIGGGPADLTSKIVSENNGIRHGAFETLHFFSIPIEKKS